MLRAARVSLNKGRPNRIKTHTAFGTPQLLKTIQGGQQYFEQQMLKDADDAAKAERERDRLGATAADKSSGSSSSVGARRSLSDIRPMLAQSNFAESRAATEESVRGEMDEWQANEPFTDKRAFNELDYYHRYKAEQLAAKRASTTATDGEKAAAATGGGSLGEDGRPPVSDTAKNLEEAEAQHDAAAHAPARINDDAFFKQKFGYSLLKGTTNLPPVDTNIKSLDHWAELPVYSKDTYFFYLIARRRNCYAVIFTSDGERIHKTYSAGNQGLKKGDKSFKSDGSAENANIVTSRYMTDAVPILVEREIAAGRMKRGEGKKIPVVVRLMGFYNARQGAIRAVMNRADVIDVKYVEDVTPFPRNGPKMPKRQIA